MRTHASRRCQSRSDAGGEKTSLLSPTPCAHISKRAGTHVGGQDGRRAGVAAHARQAERDTALHVVRNSALEHVGFARPTDMTVRRGVRLAGAVGAVRGGSAGAYVAQRTCGTPSAT
eukprot:6183032-Pleurochrysis_carterae.AAC.2